jgi:acetate kinase
MKKRCSSRGVISGIGENSPAIRERICRDLEFLGVTIDRDLNDKNASVISREGTRPSFA